MRIICVSEHITADVIGNDVGIKNGGRIPAGAFTVSSGTAGSGRLESSSYWTPSNPEGSWLKVDLGAWHIINDYEVEVCDAMVLVTARATADVHTHTGDISGSLK